MQQSLSMRRGSVLVFALLVLAILLVAALSVAGAALTEKRSAFATQQSVLAFQAADSAAERMLRRIYKNNSPTIGPPNNIAIDGDVGDDNLNQFASNLAPPNGRVLNPTCTSGQVKGTNDNPNLPYTFAVTFLDKDGKAIACGTGGWRDKVISIRSEGFFRGTSRVVEIGIRPRE